jgi:hypothetical protein
MESLFSALLSTLELGLSLAFTVLLMFFALRGMRNKYIGSTTLVLDGYSINPSAAGDETFLHISGRQKGLISWIMVLLGIETRVDVTVNGKEFVVRRGSLAGMLTSTVPLRHVRATVCGYQRSLVALFFTIYFGVNALWLSLAALPSLVQLLTGASEAVRESAAHDLSLALARLLSCLFCGGIAAAFYYFSKRIAFGVEAENRQGIVCKRSLIGNQVIELAEMEQAKILLNHLVAAANYGKPGFDIPPLPPSQPPVALRPHLRWWMLPSGYVALLILTILLNIYGSGVDLTITSKPAGAAVFIDSAFRGNTDVKSGHLLISHLTREAHTAQAQAYGFQATSSTIALGRFESEHDATLTLPPMKYPVRLYTSPGNASVSIDGQQAGISNEGGFLLIPDVERGTHQFSVSHDGYRTATETVEIRGQWAQRVELVNEAEAARQEAAVQAQSVQMHIDRARALFQQGHYQDAMTECDTALKGDASNTAAIVLRKQIEQTRKILGQ